MTPSDIASAAIAYEVCSRTFRRWRAAKVDVTDPVAFAIHIASQRNPKPEALDKAEKQLSELLNQ